MLNLAGAGGRLPVVHINHQATITARRAWPWAGIHTPQYPLFRSKSVDYRLNRVIETFAKHQYCHCERSKAISQHVDNPRDCFVASLLAMTKTAVMQRSLIPSLLAVRWCLR